MHLKTDKMYVFLNYKIKYVESESINLQCEKAILLFNVFVSISIKIITDTLWKLTEKQKVHKSFKWFKIKPADFWNLVCFPLVSGEILDLNEQK